MDSALEQRIRRAYAAFARGDLDAAVADCKRHVTLVNPEYAMEGGVRDGVGGLRALHEQFEYESVEILDILEGPAGVVVVSRCRGNGRVSRAPVDRTFAHVFELTDGNVTTHRWFRSPAEGRAAAGL